MVVSVVCLVHQEMEMKIKDLESHPPTSQACSIL